MVDTISLMWCYYEVSVYVLHCSRYVFESQRISVLYLVKFLMCDKLLRVTFYGFYYFDSDVIESLTTPYSN